MADEEDEPRTSAQERQCHAPNRRFLIAQRRALTAHHGGDVADGLGRRVRPIGGRRGSRHKAISLPYRERAAGAERGVHWLSRRAGIGNSITETGPGPPPRGEGSPRQSQKPADPISHRREA